MALTGRILVIASIALIFLAYSNFVPTSLGSPKIADYVKNHFVREVIFGAALAAYTIFLTAKVDSSFDFWRIAVAGSIVVLPFWVASAFGWSTGGLEEVWGENINAQTAYILHGTQTALFYIGLVILYLGLDI